MREQLRELAVDRARTILVILGVVWGVLSLTVVLSFGEGFGAAMDRSLRASGHNLLILWSGATTRPYGGLPAGRWIGLGREDAELLLQSVPGVRAASPEFTSFGTPLAHGRRRTNARVHGVAAAYGPLRNLTPLPGGRFINENDDSERRRVAVLGGEIRERLFGSASAVGEEIFLWGLPFTVVGVSRPRVTLGYYEGPDPEKVFVPASTMQSILGWRHPAYLVVGTRTADQDRSVLRGIYRVLGATHGFDPADEAALSVQNKIETDRQVAAIVGGTRILMGLIGILGLLVALVGVANVTYVMVEERRRDIGVQMAIGARPAQVLRGFLLEALVLVSIGGMVGVVASAGALELFGALPLGERPRGYLGRPAVSLAVALGVTAVLALAGSLAGYLPARRAASVDPVEALRAE